MSSVRVLHGALCQQMVDEQRNRLQQMLLRKLRGGADKKSLRKTSVVQKAAKFGEGGGLAPDF